ncbi:MAG: DUF3306 domain-containing protein, partial [Comamonadaceae bacterium]
MAEEDGFLSRWSRRKVQVRQGGASASEPLPVPAPQAAPVAVPGPISTSASVESEGADASAQPPQQVASAPPPPTLNDVATLTHDSDFTRFVTPEVPGEVRNAALKKLFSDPHFNVMDGLDTYIDDYNTPDPLPASMLRQMTQAAYLGLVEPEPAKAAAHAHASPPEPALAPPGEPSPNDCATGHASVAMSPAAAPA